MHDKTVCESDSLSVTGFGLRTFLVKKYSQKEEISRGMCIKSVQPVRLMFAMHSVVMQFRPKIFVEKLRPKDRKEGVQESKEKLMKNGEFMNLSIHSE